MDQINTEILRQFESQSLTINEGVAIDARLVKSASHPLSNDQIKEHVDKRNTPEGKVDKNGKPLFEIYKNVIIRNLESFSKLSRLLSHNGKTL